MQPWILEIYTTHDLITNDDDGFKQAVFPTKNTWWIYGKDHINQNINDWKFIFIGGKCVLKTRINGEAIWPRVVRGLQC